METDTNPVRASVYALVDPALIKKEEVTLTRILFETLRVSPSAHRRAQVSESSGWIEYVDTQQLWREGAPPRLSDASEARNHAERFLRSLSQAFGRAAAPAERSAAPQLPEQFVTMVMIPPLKPVDVVLVARPDGSAWDHWLYRAQPQLALGHDEHQMIDVFGSLIEVRIGEGNRVISYQARWRPLTTERVNSDLMPFSADATSEHHASGHHPSGHHGGHDEEAQHKLVYLLEGDGIPQYYLSPYYLFNEGHVVSLVGACAYSLTVALGVKQQDNGSISITALVDGGSGQYAFNWAMYTLEHIWDQRIRELGEGNSGEVQTEGGQRSQTSTVTLPPGSYVMLLNIKDRRTGAFKHHQQQVYSGPILGGREPVALSHHEHL